MHRREFLSALPAMSAVTGASQASQAAPVDIGSRLELFVDHYLLAEMRGTELRLGTPLDAGAVLTMDRSWEGAFSACFTVIRDGPLYRLYYRGEPVAGPDGNPGEVTCYAESRDGVHFVKPDLGLFEVHATRQNNVILAGHPPFSHNFSALLDERPGVLPTERFKAIAGTHRSGLYAWTSADGLRWHKLREHPVVPSPKQFVFDSQNLAFWSQSEQCYVCYFRSWRKIAGASFRWISRTTSQDFVRWDAPVEMSFGDAPPEHIYTNQTSPYPRAPHIYIGICARFQPGRQVLTEARANSLGVAPSYFKDCSDAVLLTSRGGNRYDRTFLESFLRPGMGLANWASRSNYPGLNVVETGPGELSFYATRNYGQPTAHLGRFKLRLDGFASIHAPFAGGEALTRVLRFDGSELSVNLSTSAAGGLRVEIQDQQSRPIPGYTIQEADELIGDEVERPVTWQGRAAVGALAGKPVRLRFVMKDSDLYSMRFRA